MIITIDGPAASGKSTAARLLAKKLGYYYLNSGLLYRALGYLLLEQGGYSFETIANPSESDVKKYLDPASLVYTSDDQTTAHIFFDSQEITSFLKNERIDKASSTVSTNPLVRKYLLQFQRALAVTHNVIVEGRDSGTIVFPQAQIKFFLTASLDVRAQRWQLEAEQKGIKISISEVQKQLCERDKRDTERAVAPLKIPDNAIVVDNSLYTINETVDVLLHYVEQDEALNV